MDAENIERLGEYKERVRFFDASLLLAVCWRSLMFDGNAGALGSFEIALITMHVDIDRGTMIKGMLFSRKLVSTFEEITFFF